MNSFYAAPVMSESNGVSGASPFGTEQGSLSLAQVPLTHEEQKRKQRMREAWDAYNGELPKPLKVRSGDPDDNVLTNRCAPVVDKGVSFLFGKVLKIEVADEQQQAVLDTFWGHDDQRMTLFAKMAINGGVTGQVFLKLLPRPSSNESREEENAGKGAVPRVVVLDSQLVRVVTAPEDCDLIVAYVIEYATAGGIWQRRQIIARVDPDGWTADEAGDETDLDDFWTITNYTRRGQSGAWYQAGERVVWPYPFAPIFTCQNLPNPNEVWGKPDLTPDLIEQNRVLNFVQSNTSRIIKYHAHPKTFVVGVSASQISVAVDETLCLPSPQSDLRSLELHGNLDASRNFAGDIRSDMDEQSRVPAVALGRLVDLPKGNISGVALALLFQPLIEKTQQKQRLYGNLIREVSRAVLVLSGLMDIMTMDEVKTELHWQNLLPVDDLAAAQTATLLKQLGVSQDTLLQELGYDPDAEGEKRESEQAASVTNFSRGVGLPPAMDAEGGGAGSSAAHDEQGEMM